MLLALLICCLKKCSKITTWIENAMNEVLCQRYLYFDKFLSKDDDLSWGCWECCDIVNNLKIFFGWYKVIMETWPRKLCFHRYPSHARMWVGPIRSGLLDQKVSDYQGTMDDWYNFTNETKANYGVDMSVLTKPFSEEQWKYYLQVSSLFLVSI